MKQSLPPVPADIDLGNRGNRRCHSCWPRPIAEVRKVGIRGLFALDVGKSENRCCIERTGGDELKIAFAMGRHEIVTR
jgi:hypothetical protein